LNKSKITFNALSAILQVVVVGIVYLILYKFILAQIGIKLLGVWSLVIASTSVASIANFGISSSIVKFVSTYHARKRTDLIIKLVFTALIFILITYTLISILLYFLGIHLLHFAMEEKYIGIALSILPFSLISLIINALSGVFNSAIDGIQKNYVKSYIITLSSIVILFLSFLLTPKYGLLGLVYAQIFQSIFVLFFSAFYYIKLFQFQFEFRWLWDRTLFKEIFNYGIKVQVSSILEMTADPIVKFLLSKFGGLTIVGYYEMATRLVLQTRGLIVSANQVIIPVISESKENNPGNINIVYKKVFSFVLYLNIILTTIILISAPVVSLIWIGHYESIFVNILMLSSAAFFFNISSTPAYFNFMGEGKLNDIILSISIGFLINIGLGYLLGLYFGGIGVVLAATIGLVLNSSLLLSAYHKFKEIKILDLVTKYDLKLILSSLAFIASSNYVFHSIFNNRSTYLEILLYTLCLFLFLYYIIKNHTFKILVNLTLNLFGGFKGKSV
jgi:O-antigen/teichoic acid export membrane protein